MNFKRIFALVAIAGGIVALVTSAATTGRRPIAPPSISGAPSAAAETSGAALAEEIARLRERLHPTTPPQRPARNLFQFSATRATRPPTVPQPIAVAPDTPTEIPATLPPLFALIGIAEDSAADAAGSPVRTAIIAGLGGLFLAKEGDAIASGYRVLTISNDAVELIDVERSATVHLTLKK